MSLETPEKIRTLQRKLDCKAKVEPADVADADLSKYFDAIPHADLLPWLHIRPASRLEGRPLVPGRKPIQEECPKVGDLLRPREKEPWLEARARLNRLLTGWSAYFGYGSRLPAYRAVDHHVYDRVRHLLAPRHKEPGRGVRRFFKMKGCGDLVVQRVQRVQVGPPP